jgi:adenylate cyclase
MRLATERRRATGSVLVSASVRARSTVGNVGGGGFKDFTALGDVTNTAARLQAETKGGEVMLCESTYRAAVDACAGAELRQLSLKGKAEPVTGYLIRVK